MRTPTLKRVSMRGIDRHGSGRINCRKQYLCDFGDGLYLGRFSRQWYGLNFDCDWGASGAQFDPPGENSSRWRAIFELVR
jgi:hypothetical protein